MQLHANSRNGTLRSGVGPRTPRVARGHGPALGLVPQHHRHGRAISNRRGEDSSQPGLLTRREKGSSVTTTSPSAYSDTTTPSDASVLLRRHGLRCTLSRLHMLAMLERSGLHLSSAEACAELHRLGSPFDPATAYRTLETLTAAGLTHAVHGPGPKRYGINSEPPHHHTVCEQCGEVGVLASECLRETEGRIAQMTGMRPGATGALLIYGRCALCGD
ncbi:transcriptional repressor [Streptomyces sp. NPDC005813]|uniref:Fur family transcriptional regulator n=1 Tax=Streptomyces sp. NPDC005813 TaxID=3155592 RepID=UPI0033EAF89C